jgi:hypothetical protein
MKIGFIVEIDIEMNFWTEFEIEYWIDIEIEYLIEIEFEEFHLEI